MLSSRGAATLSLAALLARVALACFGWGEALSQRIELSSPADSVLRLREGHALAGLHSLPGCQTGYMDNTSTGCHQSVSSTYAILEY